MATKTNTQFIIYFILSIVQTFPRINGQSPPPKTEQTAILWSLSPCQSAFWIPSTPNEFSQNWITYQYEGNPLSQSGECIYTLESDPDTKIEVMIQDINLYGTGTVTPVPCLSIYDVKQDGSIVVLKKQCNVNSANDFSTFSLFTEGNLAVVSSTLRYGSFLLQARAVPRNFGVPTKVISSSSNTPLAIDSIATVAPLSRPTSTNAPPISMMPSVEMILPTKVNSSSNFLPNVITG